MVRGPRFTRRQVLQAAALGGGALALGGLPALARPKRSSTTSSPSFTPFQVDLALPGAAAPCAPFTPTCFVPPGLPTPTFYELHLRPGTAQILPGIDTEIWGYDGLFPGPTLRARVGEPVVVRFVNELPAEMSTHLHGGHTPSDSDGFPNFFIPPGGFRDYCYPGVLPGGDVNEATTTTWYHDHAMDTTGEHVYRGLAGYYLVTDPVEEQLIAGGKLPAADCDLPLVIQDRRFNADGSLFYDPFSHDGFLGDVFLVNGRAQPRLKVQRKKYRFRILNGSNARFYELRLSNGASFLQLSNDGWLLPQAVVRPTLLMASANRADVIVDFRNAPNEVFLENILEQQDGRGPSGTVADHPVTVPGFPLLKFVVEGPVQPDNATLAPGQVVRPHTAIRPDEIAATRTFEFARSRGAWVVNGQFFDPDKPAAAVARGTAERWILKNGGGGWWHPIHIHLEAMQVQRINGKPPPLYDAFNKDTHILGPGDVAEVFLKFRTFTGPYVFHCHNIEHEDMRMMLRFDVVG
jgi:FtsP/CotA-like multicopper oxidase with cupredoxin domain